MLAAKGKNVTLFLRSGRRVKPRGAMLHDETGQWWSPRSVLFMPFSRSDGGRFENAAAKDKPAEMYFG